MFINVTRKLHEVLDQACLMYFLDCGDAFSMEMAAPYCSMVAYLCFLL